MFELDLLVEALLEVKRKGSPAQEPGGAPTPSSRPQAEVFTPEALEALLDRVQTQRRPWDVVLEGGEKIRIYPTREQWERERGRREDGAVEFYAAELRRALPMLKAGYTGQVLALKRAFGGELVDWRPPAIPSPEPPAPSPTPPPAPGKAQAEPPSRAGPPPRQDADQDGPPPR